MNRLTERSGCEVVGMSRAEMDLNSSAAIRTALEAAGAFDLLINCAAWTDVDACETGPEKANQINGHAVGVMAEVAARRSARMIQVSTDYVFDGAKTAAYEEDDATGPISAYGASKLIGEQELLGASPDHLVVRVSWLFGASTGGFPLWVIRQAMKSDTLSIVADKWGSPTNARDAAEALEFLAFEAPAARGILHFCNSGQTSWHGWGQCALDHARQAGVPLRTLQLAETNMQSLAAKAGWKAPRPVHSALSCERYAALRGAPPRPWQEAVGDYVVNEVAPSVHAGQL
jgi:dTDP-4-dehydrorhamnose reductase